MRDKKISIKWKLITYMACFVAAEFILLSAFHMFFLDSFYKNIKVNELKSAAKTIVANVDSDDFETVLKDTAREGGMRIELFDSEGNDIFGSGETPMGVSASPEIRKKLYIEAEKAGNTVETWKTVINKSPDDHTPKGNKNAPDNKADIQDRYDFVDEADAKNMHHDGPEIIMLIQTVEIDGKEAAVALSTALTPLFATREILNVETMYICSVLLVVSVLLAILIFRKISKPIVQTNEKAMLLAGGNYDVKFDSDGYREISELNDTLTFAASELNRTETLRRDLMANISHDLRTPITMIRGYAELMRDIPGEANEENIQIIIDETNRLSNLVTDILDLSKLQSGVEKLNKTDFSITDSINGILNRYSKIKAMEGYTINFENDGDVFINADSIKISQVLYNLINNAINYTGEDKTVTVRQKVNGNTVRIEISDTGEGIDEENIKFIWDRYYKVDKTHKRPVSGTGIGLSIVKNILELHGFKYGVMSKKGEGSTFYFEAEKI